MVVGFKYVDVGVQELLDGFQAFIVEEVLACSLFPPICRKCFQMLKICL